MPDSREPLRWLLAPNSVDDFSSAFWERRPLLVRRQDPAYYSKLITLRQFDELLATNGEIARTARVLRGGREMELHRHPRMGGASALEQIYAHYRDGATISIVHIHNGWPPLSALCRDLADVFSARCQTNVYLTPQESQGLRRHFDTHDVFVLQVEGLKRWRLGASAIDHPLPHQNDAEIADHDELHEIDLVGGDLLYIPRGFVHEAVSLDSASFHLTIGILPITYADVLRIEIDNLLDSDARYRSALPMGFDRDRAAYAEAVERIPLLLDSIRNNLSAREAIDNAKQILTVGRGSGLRGHLLDLEALRTIDSGLEVQRRPGLRYEINHDRPGKVQITFHGKAISLPAIARGVIEFMATGQTFTAADLPGHFDEASRLVIVRRLLREGFLTTSGGNAVPTKD